MKSDSFYCRIPDNFSLNQNVFGKILQNTIRNSITIVIFLFLTVIPAITLPLQRAQQQQKQLERETSQCSTCYTSCLHNLPPTTCFFLILPGVHVKTHVNGNSHSPERDRHTSPQHGYSSPSYGDSPGYQYGRFDASALHIAHALKQTELQKAYRTHREKPIDCYLVSI